VYSVAKGIPPEIENDPKLRKAMEQVRTYDAHAHARMC
jgi:hypothetical protein